MTELRTKLEDILKVDRIHLDKGPLGTVYRDDTVNNIKLLLVNIVCKIFK